MQAAQRIVAFAEQTDAARFQEDVFTPSAILHQFMVLGEATKRFSDAFRAAHPDIPWRQMAGMRDRLIHNYKPRNYPKPESLRVARIRRCFV